MASATGRILFGLLVIELFDLLFVSSALLQFFLTVWSFFLWRGISPKLSKELRDICVGHIRVFSLYSLSRLLRKLQKCRHGSVWMDESKEWQN